MRLSSTSQESTSALLTQYGLVYGGGASAAPATVAACGANFPIIGQSSAAPVCSTIAYPSTLTSGSLLYASSTTGIATGSLITANSLIKSGGAGTAPAAAGITDNSTVVTVTDPGGLYLAPSSAAGALWIKQGSAQTTQTTAVGITAPTSVTSYTILLPGSASSTVNNNALSFSATASNITTASFVPITRKSILTSQYSNATATPSTIWSFSVDASTNYQVECQGIYKAASGGAFELTLTGPASPTNVSYTFTPEVNLASNTGTYLDYESGVATTYPTSINTPAVTAAATDMSFTIIIGLNNGTTAGTLAIQGNTISTNTLNIEIGSTCTII